MINKSLYIDCIVSLMPIWWKECTVIKKFIFLLALLPYHVLIGWWWHQCSAIPPREDYCIFSNGIWLEITDYEDNKDNSKDCFQEKYHVGLFLSHWMKFEIRGTSQQTKCLTHFRAKFLFYTPENTRKYQVV